MDFGFDERTRELQGAVRAFLDDSVLPAEPLLAAELRERDADPARRWSTPAVVEDLKGQAREREPVESLPARGARRRADQPAVRPARGAVRPQPDARTGGDELRRARHREHGAPRHVRNARAAGPVAPAAAGRARSAPRSA